jgi:hypothetical protein
VSFDETTGRSFRHLDGNRVFQMDLRLAIAETPEEDR